MASGLENIETIESPFRRFVTTIGVFPTAFTDAMTYYECLAYLVKYLEETAIPAVNQNAEAVEELQEKYIELKTFVDTYFDNLDVQNEINEKLDKMAEDGVLAEILNEYVQPSVNELSQNIQTEVSDRIEADNQLRSEIQAVASGAPLVAASTSEMTDQTKIYVNTSDGHWYYWDGSAWTDGGTYQAAEDSFSTDYLEAEMHSIAKDVELTYTLTWTDGYRLTIGEGTPYTAADFSYSNYLPYIDAYRLRIDGVATTSAQTIVCFYAADGTYLGSHSLQYDIRVQDTPDGTAKFRFCIKTADKSGVTSSAKLFVNRRIKELSEYLNILDTVNLFNKNITTNVNVGDTVTITPSTASQYRYIIYPCVEGDIFLVNGKGGANPRLWAFLDQNNKLLAKSDSGLNGLFKITAPAKTAKLICNFNYSSADVWDSFYLYQLTDPNLQGLSTGYDYATKIDVTNKNITTNVNAGETVTLTPSSVNGWKYIILNCAEGDEFIVKGQGGDNPRLWAFVDSSNKLITKSDRNIHGKFLITAPQNAAKLICNFNNTESYHLYSGDDNTLEVLGYKLDNFYTDPRDSYQQVITPPANATSAFMRGVTLQHQLNNYLTDFKKPSDTMCHVSTFKIIGGVVYVTYYASETSTGEDPTKHIVRFVYAPLNNLSNKTYFDIQKVGDTFDGHTVTAIYDTILMKIDNDNLAIMWTCQLDGVYTRLYQTYNITNATFGDIEYNYFKVGNNTAIFNTTNMNTLLGNAGISHKPISVDIGIMQKVTSRVENGVTTYYTGCYAGAFNCIIKTTNFITWEFVASPSFEDDSMFENACYLKDDKVFYFIRQQDKCNYGLLSYYDLTTNTWADPVKVNDTQSRSDFIERSGELYLVHACQNRQQISIMFVNRTYLQKSMEFNDACMVQSFYPYVDMYANEYYMSYTQNRQHIYFSKFTFGANDNYLVEGLYNKLFA